MRVLLVALALPVLLAVWGLKVHRDLREIRDLQAQQAQLVQSGRQDLLAQLERLEQQARRGTQALSGLKEIQAR